MTSGRAGDVGGGRSLYDVLGVPATATTAELRQAFVTAARRHHPDRHATADAATRRSAEARMRELNDAWSVLGDDNRRADYNLMLRRAREAAARASGASGRTGQAGRAGGPGPTRGAPGTTGAAGSRGTGAGTGNTGGPRVSGPRVTGHGGTPPAGVGRDWRSYASPGPAGAAHRSLVEQLFVISPVLCLAAAGFFGAAGALIGWPPFFAAALVAVFFAAAAFFLVPIWTMARAGGRRSGSSPGRGAAGRPGNRRPASRYGRRPAGGPPPGGPERPAR